jgi:hypothetical protein
MFYFYTIFQIIFIIAVVNNIKAEFEFVTAQLKSRGAHLKKYIYIVLFFLLAAVFIGVFAGSNNEIIISQSLANSSQSTLESAYQDIQWGINVQKNLRLIKSDFDNVSSALNNSNYTALAISAQYLIDDTQRAIKEDDQYTVSPKLQEAQKEWRAALQESNSAGKLLLKGANEAKRGVREFENFQKAAALNNSITTHLKKVSESLGINLSLNESVY